MSDSIENQLLCYGLPYGIIGIIGWLFSILKTFIHLIYPGKQTWYRERLSKWCGRQLSLYLLTIISSVIEIGPVIYTSIKCRGEWSIILVSLGNLSLLGYSMISAVQGYNKALKEYAVLKRNEEYEKLRWWWKVLYYVGIKNEKFRQIDEDEKEEKKGNDLVSSFGTIFVILTSILGWIGATGLLINSYKIEGIKVLSVIIIYIAAISLPFISFIWLYFAMSLHIVVSCVLIAIVTHRLIGIKTEKIEDMSFILFFVGEFFTLVRTLFENLGGN
ncbi:hypothetical protein Glove_177g28 [Diversispora epigaea]|uniref:Uncharacterized protein n=1 Tax=Diversispora epigaea TaxID=1348612 RepID=A0A397IWP1_9GLOM|nr:hypothetical protein Glove_177g28 [Diversispora epigaea]